MGNNDSCNVDQLMAEWCAVAANVITTIGRNANINLCSQGGISFSFLFMLQLCEQFMMRRKII